MTPTHFETRADYERALRNRLGLTRGAAKKLSAAWATLAPGDDHEDEQELKPSRRPQEDNYEMSIQSLREARAEKVKKLEAMVASKAWNAATDKPAYDAQLAEVEDLSRRIELIQASTEKVAAAAVGGHAVSADVWSAGEHGDKYAVMNKSTNFKSAYPRQHGEDVTLSDFLRGIAGGKTSEAVRNALSEGTNSAGGYAVPTVLMPDILQALVPVSSLLQAGAGIIDVSSGGGKSFSTAAVDTIPTAAWRAESAALSESGPTFRSIPAVPRSLAFFFKVSRELLADALGLDQALQTVIGQAFAKELDRVGLRGSGTPPEPTGILNTVGIQAVTNGTNGASLATTAYTNFVSAVNALLSADAPMPTAAIMSPRSLTVLGGLLDSQNQPRRVPPMLDGVKLIATSQVPNNLTVGSSSDCSEIYVGDFSKVSFVIREKPSIQIAKELYAGTGQIGFIAHLRADVAVSYPAAFAVATGVRP